MLKKLIKHEFKNTSKVMLAIYALVAVVTLLGTISFVLLKPYVESGIVNFLSRMSLVLYVLSIFALFIVTYVYMCIHFYKSMYSDQGYLTHTLPVSPLTTFHVKLGVSLCWLICSFLVMFVSLCLLLISVTHGEFFSIFTAESLSTFNAELAEIDMTAGKLFAFAIFSVILSCISYLLMVFASISIGQLFNQNKIGFSIVAGIAIYFVEQIAGTVLMFSLLIPSSSALLTEESMYAEIDTASSFWNSTMFSSSILSLLFCIILYAVCNIIVRKHINLD